MPNIILENRPVTYNIKYSKRRRSVQIKIVPPGNIEVIAPTRLHQTEIECLLRQRTTWITTGLERLAKLSENPVNASLDEGTELLYLGSPRKLIITQSAVKRARVTLEEESLTIQLPALSGQDKAAALETALRNWYIRSATELLQARTAYWAEQIGVRPQNISIREQKTRWGSCSSHRNLNYNWRIVMAPPEVVDYLVVHELCHIKVPNHSADFWLLVGQSVPDFKKHRLWLRQHGVLLSRLMRRY